MTLTLPLPHPNHLRAVVQYTAIEVHQALESAGFPPELWTVFDAIAGAESSWLPMVIQQGEPYATTGWGTWQITPGNSVPAVGIDRQLLPIAVNARAAKVKYEAQGLDAWTTWRSGRYKLYLR
jgi:hypothetical protein